jgi:hypothetical protein
LTGGYKTPLKEFLEVSGRNPKIRMKTGTMFAIVEKI